VRAPGVEGAAASTAEAPAGMRTCAWCRQAMGEYTETGRRVRKDATTCSTRCRQARANFRVREARLEAAERPMRFAYADPPYPGRAHKYPENEEVDHGELVALLEREFGDGWALSTAADRLQDVLALCPPGVLIGSWHRPLQRTYSSRALSAWEPVIVRGGRPLAMDKPQVVTNALVARGRHRSHPHAMVGMKPPAFAVWIFEQLGARPGDELVDLYPGSGAVSQAWDLYVGQSPVTAAGT
jgi:hypothetical protein